MNLTQPSMREKTERMSTHLHVRFSIAVNSNCQVEVSPLPVITTKVTPIDREFYAEQEYLNFLLKKIKIAAKIQEKCDSVGRNRRLLTTIDNFVGLFMVFDKNCQNVLRFLHMTVEH